MGQYGDFDRANPNYERNHAIAEHVENGRRKSKKRDSKHDASLFWPVFSIIIAFMVFGVISRALQ